MWTKGKELLVKYFAEVTALIVFGIYIITLAPSVIQIDAGELSTAQATLGIAHPTGYPLFTIAGYLFLKLPLPFTTIFKANLLAAIWCALGIYLFIKSALIILTNLEKEILPNKKDRSRKESKSEKTLNNNAKNALIILPSLTGAAVLAFSKTYWFQSTSVEVYSLQIFLFMLITFLILKAYYSIDGKIINWIWVALALALGFGNHMTTLLVLPFITILFFQKEKIQFSSFKRILIMLAVFIPALVMIYLFLPLRAMANPQINWGNPINLENILRHVSGKQYQVWLFSSFEAAGKQFRYFLSGFPLEFGYSGLLIGILGLTEVFKRSRIIFYALVSTFLFTLLYSINYDIVDIDSYFLLAYIMFSFFTVFGFYKTARYFSSKLKFRNSIVLVSFISIFPLVLNFGEVNQRDVYTFEDYTRAVLNSTEKNSIIISYQWDYFVSASYYFQTVENVRPDITVIDKELLRRSWFYNQLRRNHPDVWKNIIPEASIFIESVLPFERNERYDANVIERNYRAVMTNLVAKNIENRNCYLGPEIFQNEVQRGEFALPDGYQFVPYLFLFKVVKGSDYTPAPDPDFTIRFPNNRNKYIDFIETITATMLTYRAAYELQFNKSDRAKIYLNKVRKDFPNYQIPADLEYLVN